MRDGCAWCMLPSTSSWVSSGMHAYIAASSAHCLIVTLSGRSDSDDTLHRTAESLTHA